ncbi:hypothetical protein MKEN_00755600 [Mycena kentingensis (nom. inval.)]|nr:hypothetical protein MKEN_00755600 [Mycena kentingensis (nom. inval.)]
MHEPECARSAPYYLSHLGPACDRNLADLEDNPNFVARPPSTAAIYIPIIFSTVDDLVDAESTVLAALTKAWFRTTKSSTRVKGMAGLTLSRAAMRHPVSCLRAIFEACKSVENRVFMGVLFDMDLADIYLSPERVEQPAKTVFTLFEDMANVLETFSQANVVDVLIIAPCPGLDFLSGVDKPYFKQAPIDLSSKALAMTGFMVTSSQFEPLIKEYTPNSRSGPKEAERATAAAHRYCQSRMVPSASGTSVRPRFYSFELLCPLLAGLEGGGLELEKAINVLEKSNKRTTTRTALDALSKLAAVTGRSIIEALGRDGTFSCDIAETTRREISGSTHADFVAISKFFHPDVGDTERRDPMLVVRLLKTLRIVDAYYLDGKMTINVVNNGMKQFLKKFVIHKYWPTIHDALNQAHASGSNTLISEYFKCIIALREKSPNPPALMVRTEDAFQEFVTAQLAATCTPETKGMRTAPPIREVGLTDNKGPFKNKKNLPPFIADGLHPPDTRGFCAHLRAATMCTLKEFKTAHLKGAYEGTRGVGLNYTDADAKAFSDDVESLDVEWEANTIYWSICDQKPADVQPGGDGEPNIAKIRHAMKVGKERDWDGKSGVVPVGVKPTFEQLYFTYTEEVDGRKIRCRKSFKWMILESFEQLCWRYLQPLKGKYSVDSRLEIRTVTGDGPTHPIKRVAIYDFACVVGVFEIPGEYPTKRTFHFYPVPMEYGLKYLTPQ